MWLTVLSVLLVAVPLSASATEMQAAVVNRASIAVKTVQRPDAGPGQVLVKLHYAGVNPADWKRASEQLARPAHDSIPGYDGAGIVAAVGRGVSGLQVGDAVMAWSRRGGTYAQYVAVPADCVVHKPATLGFAEAAAMPQAGLAAWTLLIELAKIKPGQKVLVLGGAGGVGSAAVQIAKHSGAFVIATGSAGSAQYLQSLGVDQFIDYQAQHFEAQLRDIDVAVNTVDGDNAFRALAVLRRGGYLVSSVEIPAAGQCQARAVSCAALVSSATAPAVVLQQLAAWASAGRYQVHIDKRFALGEVLKAWEYSQAGHTRGKSVIYVSD